MFLTIMKKWIFGQNYQGFDRIVYDKKKPAKIHLAKDYYNYSGRSTIMLKIKKFSKPF